MTADVLAEFVSRPAGLTYGNVCDRWHVDPAGFIEDEVLAYNFRAALALRISDAAPEPEPDPFEEARIGAERVRQWQD